MNTTLIDDVLTIVRDRMTQEERTLLMVGIQEVMKEASAPQEVSYEGDQMMSLYEYLGRAAGGQLGSEVFRAAKANKVPFDQQMVSTRTYTGKVMLYPQTFLKEYFGD